MYQDNTNRASSDQSRFIEAFEDCALEPGSFRHQDHVRLAWLYLTRYPVTEAIERYVAGLKRFASAAGAPEKYHETITWAYLLLTHERMGRMTGDHTWHEFAEANEDLLDWSNTVLDLYYTKETLGSSLARKVFVLPDKRLSAP